MIEDFPKTNEYYKALDEKKKKIKLYKFNAYLMFHNIYVGQLSQGLREQVDEQLLDTIKD